MRGPGQAENPQFGVKVDNKYDAIADNEDPFDALEQLAAAPKDAGADKSKKSAADKTGAGAKKDKAAEVKKDATGKPQSAGAKPDATKTQAARGGAEKPKTAGDKPAHAENAQQGQRRPRGGAAPRGGAMPLQAGVVGLTTNVPEPAHHAGGEDDGAGNTDGFQQTHFGSAGNRGRRGAPRGQFAGPASAGGGFRRPPYRGGFGGPRYPAAPHAAGAEEGAAQPAAGTAEGGEGEERLDRNFERRGGRAPGGFRGAGGYARRGGYRRGPAPPGAGYFEDGTGRKREFERHSGSDVTGVRPVDKREGSGAHNWGTARDDLAGQTEALPETEEGAEKRAAGEGDAGLKEAKAGEAWTDLVNADESAKAAEGDTGAGEQDKMYVLDDWKAKEEKERFHVPEFNVRKANEGVDTSSKWGGFVLKKRENEEDEEEEVVAHDDDAAQDADDAKRKGKQRVMIPVTFTENFRGGRGGRGGSRGGPYERRDGEQRGYDRDRPRFDRPPRGGNNAARGGFRGAPGGGQAGAPQLSMDEFPSLNKQAA